MALLLPPKPGIRKEWTFAGRKHSGEVVESVAKKDPGYIEWAWKEASALDDPSAFDMLTDIAAKFDIKLGEKKQRHFRKLRITHDRSRKRR